MTQEQETVLLIRGTIASLPDENRKMAEDCYRDLSAMVRKGNYIHDYPGG